MKLPLLERVTPSQRPPSIAGRVGGVLLDVAVAVAVMLAVVVAGAWLGLIR